MSDLYSIRQTYKNNVEKINLDMKKKYFTNILTDTINKKDVLQAAYDVKGKPIVI